MINIIFLPLFAILGSLAAHSETILLEAESGDMTGKTKIAGNYIYSDKHKKDGASYKMKVESKGTYVVSFLARGESARDTTFLLITNGKKLQIDLNSLSSGFEWKGEAVENRFSLELKKGTNKIRLRQLSEGLELDAIRFQPLSDVVAADDPSDDEHSSAFKLDREESVRSGRPYVEVDSTDILKSPKMFFEKHNNHFVVRLEMQHLRLAQPDYLFRDTVFDPKPSQTILWKYKDLDVKGTDVSLHNIHLGLTKTGMKIRNNRHTSVYDLSFDDFENTRDQYGMVMSVGTKLESGDNTNSGYTYVQNVYADGHEEPLVRYHESNRDFMMIEGGSGPIYVRDVTAKNVSDSFFDTKGPSTLYIMNATLDSAHYALRVRNNVELIIVNSVVNVPKGEFLAQVEAGASLKYYNVSWNGQETIAPELVKGKYQVTSDEEALNYITKLNSNPLRGVSDFFGSELDAVFVETSSDGVNWSLVRSLGKKGDGMATQGDLRFEIPKSEIKSHTRIRYIEMDGAERVILPDSAL
ncbi:MAG: hypothetical protein AAF202_00400 [Pseudomonadota bacterium]